MPIEEYGDKPLRTRAAEAPVFVFSPELNRFEVAKQAHMNAFKEIFRKELHEKFNRTLNDAQFDHIWPLIEQKGDADIVSLSKQFRASCIQGAMTRDGKIELFHFGVTPKRLQSVALFLKSHGFDNVPVVLSTTKKQVELGNLHQIPGIPQKDLAEKLAGIGKHKKPDLSADAIHDLMLEMSKAVEAPKDMRYFLLEHVNDIRESHGLEPLRLDEEEAGHAKKHADYMLSVQAAVTTPPQLLGARREITAHGEYKAAERPEDEEREIAEQTHELLLKKTLLNAENRKIILDPKIRVMGADISTRLEGGKERIALSARFK